MPTSFLDAKDLCFLSVCNKSYWLLAGEFATKYEVKMINGNEEWTYVPEHWDPDCFNNSNLIPK